MDNKVNICGMDTSALPRLTDEESISLLNRIAQGDEEARQRFVLANMRLVLSAIKRFWSARANADDIFQVGCIGLIKAIDNFDTSLGVKFSTYGLPMRIGEIRRHLRDSNALRISRSMRDTAYKAMQAAEQLSRQGVAEPTCADIAARIGSTEQAVAAALTASQEPISIYEPIYRDGNDAVYMIDQLGDGNDEDWSGNLALHDAVQQLEGREKSIIYLRYFMGCTQMEIAGEIGISQAQVSRIEKSALSRIRRRLE